MTRSVRVGFFGIFFALVIIPFLFRYHQKTLAMFYTDEGMEFRVVAYSFDRLDGWYVIFCWRNDKEPWREYYLDHEACLWHDWPDVRVQVSSNEVRILSGFDERAVFNIQKKLFRHSRNGLVPEAQWLVDSDNPLDRELRGMKELRGQEIKGTDSTREL